MRTDPGGSPVAVEEVGLHAGRASDELNAVQPPKAGLPEEHGGDGGRLMDMQNGAASEPLRWSEVDGGGGRV